MAIILRKSLSPVEMYYYTESITWCLCSLIFSKVKSRWLWGSGSSFYDTLNQHSMVQIVNFSVWKYFHPLVKLQKLTLLNIFCNYWFRTLSAVWWCKFLNKKFAPKSCTNHKFLCLLYLAICMHVQHGQWEKDAHTHTQSITATLSVRLQLTQNPSFGSTWS